MNCIPEEKSSMIYTVAPYAAHPETGTLMAENHPSAISMALTSENVPTNICTSGSAQISCSGSFQLPTIVKVENEENSIAQWSCASQQPVLHVVKSENTSTSASPSISQKEVPSMAISRASPTQNVNIIPAGHQFDLPYIQRSSTLTPSITKSAANLEVPNFKSSKPFILKSARPNVLKKTRHDFQSTVSKYQNLLTMNTPNNPTKDVLKPPKSLDFMAMSSSNANNSTLEDFKPNHVDCLNIGFEDDLNNTPQSEKPSASPLFLQSYSSSAVTNSPTVTNICSSPLFVVQDATESYPSSGLIPYVRTNVDNSAPVPLLLTKALTLSKAKNENISCWKRPWTETLEKLKHIESTNETSYVFANPPTSTNVEKPTQTKSLDTSTTINVQKPKQTKNHKTTASLCSVCNIGKIQEPSSRPQVKKMVSKWIQTLPSDRHKKCQTDHLANFKKRTKGTTCTVPLCITESIGVQFPPNSQLPDFAEQNWLLNYSDHPSSSSESEEDSEEHVFRDFSNLSQLPTIQYRILH